MSSIKDLETLLPTTGSSTTQEDAFTDELDVNTHWKAKVAAAWALDASEKLAWPKIEESIQNSIKTPSMSSCRLSRSS